MNTPMCYIIFSLLFLLGCSHQQVVDKELTSPLLKEKASLKYPLAAQKRGLEGIVTMQLFITEKGNIIKAEILQSSGHKMLDDAAIEYAQELKFYPSKVPGEDRLAAITWKVKFEISGDNRFASDYVRRIEKLYEQAELYDGVKRDMAFQQILSAHEDFAVNMTDIINYNKFIQKVIMPATFAEWQDIWNEIPLRFVAFHDAIERFPEHRYNPIVLSALQKFIVEDIDYIEQMYLTGAMNKGEKDVILNKIITFFGKKYPEMKLK